MLRLAGSVIKRGLEKNGRSRNYTSNPFAMKNLVVPHFEVNQDQDKHCFFPRSSVLSTSQESTDAMVEQNFQAISIKMDQSVILGPSNQLPQFGQLIGKKGNRGMFQPAIF